MNNIVEYLDMFIIPVTIIIVVVVLTFAVKRWFRYLWRSESKSERITPRKYALDEQLGKFFDFEPKEKEEIFKESKERIEKLRLLLESEQINQLIQYHKNSLIQSHISFWFSIIAACFGFIVIIAGGILIFFLEKPSMAYLTVLSGAIIDAVAALFFQQTNRARRSMTEFFDKLRTDRKFNESLRLCRSVSNNDLQSMLKVRLSLYFAGIESDQQFMQSLAKDVTEFKDLSSKSSSSKEVKSK